MLQLGITRLSLLATSLRSMPLLVDLLLALLVDKSLELDFEWRWHSHGFGEDDRSVRRHAVLREVFVDALAGDGLQEVADVFVWEVLGNHHDQLVWELARDSVRGTWCA